MLVSLVGLALTLGNWLSVLLVVIGFFAAHLPRIRVEEKVLEENLGKEYRDFERGGKRLIPRGLVRRHAAPSVSTLSETPARP